MYVYVHCYEINDLLLLYLGKDTFFRDYKNLLYIYIYMSLIKYNKRPQQIVNTHGLPWFQN